MTGSHMDTQPRGGRFDGIYGVLAGFEALEAIDEPASDPPPIEVVAWTNEEGGRFAPCTMGSMVYTGARHWRFARGDGQRRRQIKDALAQTLAATPSAARIQRPPPLTSRRISSRVRCSKRRGASGVVTGIQGLRWFNVEVSGKTARRHDAADCARTRCATHRDHQRADRNSPMTAPTSCASRSVRMLVTPNSPNSVPSHVLFSVEIRHPDPATSPGLALRRTDGAGSCAKYCAVKVTPTLHDDPCAFPRRGGLRRTAAQALGARASAHSRARVTMPNTWRACVRPG